MNLAKTFRSLFARALRPRTYDPAERLAAEKRAPLEAELIQLAHAAAAGQHDGRVAATIEGGSRIPPATDFNT